MSDCLILRVPARADLTSAPLETERLVLRPAAREDAAEFFLAVEESRSELEPWLPWASYLVDPSSAWRYLEACEQDWDEAKACRFVVRERSTAVFLGIVSFENFVHVHQAVDFGYWVRTSRRGNGLAQEAGHALLTWAFRALDAERIRVAAATENRASLRVIQRLGFRFEGNARRAEWCQGRWLDHAVHALVREDRRGPI